MDSSIQDRLRAHAESFDGLLSLIPADIYYGKDNSDQWKKKKQTKEQAAAARRAKLDPDSATSKTAKDVMDERARKRKLDQVEEAEGFDIEGVEKELPKEGLKLAQDNKAKKQKITDGTNGQASTEESKAERKAAKAEKAKLKAGKKAEKRKEKKSITKQKLQEKTGKKVEGQEADVEVAADIEAEDEPVGKEEKMVDGEYSDDGDTVIDEGPGGEINFEADGLEEQNESASPESSPPSPTFDNPTEPSANTSTSSVIPPATAPKHIKLPTDPELLRSRLAARIEALRAARKADGPDGRPARNRQELLEARRKKEEQRKAHKKEIRLKAKIDEDAKREAALASARDSPASSMMSPLIHSPEQNFSFGRVAFADGQEMSEDLTALKNAPKKRGPQDAASALKATEKNRLRLAGLDDTKRADIEEKDLWLNAKKRAHGEKVRDDTSLLKKTLKRKEKSKKKSEKEWSERKEGVAKGQAMRQKKREENLQKRRDGKGVKSKGSKSSKSVKGKKKSRPGFEGALKGQMTH
ncbi:related to RRP14 Protein involved in Ribosomal RNA Processing [Rhynchosporium graminicola]|uniref:Related to RRP14 Protein involved in Ribosomal RNA Processing n=1 Tax=Rhynchosporium graminicola TaxID=2792576 RepID=A0A1E1K3A0_9HELO|nr:related to RRP14 Protein involved in Ribosomal RNA Processing [Rhynchosporium commune]